MKINVLIGCSAVALLTACATPSKTLNSVSVGMTKAEVIQIMGEPQSTSATGGTEYLLYTLNDGASVATDALGQSHLQLQTKNSYFVRLKGGLVDSYGRVGDFDSTKPPEVKHDINLHIDQ